MTDVIIRYAFMTATGGRTTNMDRYLVDNVYNNADDCEGSVSVYSDNFLKKLHAVAVCDGVGGCDNGEEASRLVIQSIANDVQNYKDEEDLLKAATTILNNAQEIIVSKIKETYKTYYTTLTLLLWRENNMLVCNIGDSPAYLYRNNELIRLTPLHTLEERKIENGEKPAPNDSHILTRYVGLRGLEEKKGIEIADYCWCEIKEGDRFLVCSDGFTEKYTEEQMENDFSNGKTGEEIVKTAGEAIRDFSFGDNTTVVILETLKSTQHTESSVDMLFDSESPYNNHQNRKRNILKSIILKVWEAIREDDK